jgi:hypothetical protein
MNCSAKILKISKDLPWLAKLVKKEISGGGEMLFGGFDCENSWFVGAVSLLLMAIMYFLGTASSSLYMPYLISSYKLLIGAFYEANSLVAERFQSLLEMVFTKASPSYPTPFSQPLKYTTDSTSHFIESISPSLVTSAVAEVKPSASLMTYVYSQIKSALYVNVVLNVRQWVCYIVGGDPVSVHSINEVVVESILLNKNATPKPSGKAAREAAQKNVMRKQAKMPTEPHFNVMRHNLMSAFETTENENRLLRVNAVKMARANALKSISPGRKRKSSSSMTIKSSSKSPRKRSSSPIRSSPKKPSNARATKIRKARGYF